MRAHTRLLEHVRDDRVAKQRAKGYPITPGAVSLPRFALQRSLEIHLLALLC